LRKITKRVGFEPALLSSWKRQNPTGRYSDLTHIERQAIRDECASEQFFLCAYCCKPISGQQDDTMNEHVEARSIAQHRDLDFTNIAASCTTPNQCDDSHKAQPLPLTPFMSTCETELIFSLSGRVKGNTADAVTAIDVLNLGRENNTNRSLIEQRKQFIYTILLANGINAEDGLDDDELIEMVINDISTPVNGKLEAFSSVVSNVLNQWIA
jgi:uncharacterized protein (TIGR02646 family)